MRMVGVLRICGRTGRDDAETVGGVAGVDELNG